MGKSAEAARLLRKFFEFKFSASPFFLFAWEGGGGWREMTLEYKPSFGSAWEVLGSSGPQKAFLWKK